MATKIISFKLVKKRLNQILSCIITNQKNISIVTSNVPCEHLFFKTRTITSKKGIYYLLNNSIYRYFRVLTSN